MGDTGLNYYEHHLGDYDGATSHLSWDEDLAYRRLICLYYRTEAPIPADVKQACRLVRAVSKPQRDAVQQVLAEFFELRDDGWHNDRCDRDITAFLDLEPEREAKRENAKERQRRARERRAELFEVLRGHNIVPPFDTTTRALEALLSRVTSAPPDTAPVTPVTRDNTATHTHLPTPTTQIKEKNPPATRVPPCPDGVSAQVWADWLALRKAKKAPVTQTVIDGAVAEAQKAGMTTDQFLAVWCSRGSQGLQAEWIKPNERPAAQRANGHDIEPEWRREQRERNEAYLGPAAARRRPTTIDAEAHDAATDLLG